MTIVNINFTCERGFMVCDTLSYLDSKPHHLWTKFNLFPALPAVMSVRGNSGMHLDAERWFQLIVPSSLDEVAERLPIHLSYKAADRAEDGHDPKSIFFILGFDSARQSMRLLTLLSDDDFQPVWREPGTYLNPSAGDSFVPPAIVSNPAQTFAKVALLQKQMMERSQRFEGGELYGGGIGGELQMVEMTAKAMRITTIHRFHDYEESVRQAAEVRDSHA
jgi:hypothetical protein